MKSILALMTVLCSSVALAQPLTPVTMQLNWHPQADFGGYFTAKAEGLYEKAGLDVTVKAGGPQLNIHQLLAAGQVDFVMGTSVRTMVIRNQGIPIIAVGAFYQRDPVTFMVHADSGYNKVADLKGKPVYLPGIARLNYWPWLRSTVGFADDQIKPYDPTYRGVMLDKAAASQGYLTEDGFSFRKLGMNGKSIWLAEHGWNPYSSTLDTTDRFIAEKPKVVEAFLKATAEGYRRYLQDPAKAFALIRQANPAMPQEQMEYAYSVMKSRNLMDPPGVKIGSMTDARWEATHKILSESGVVPATFDFRKAYTLQFVKTL